MQDLLKRIAEGMLKMMPEECVKAWWKLEPYFDFFRNLICFSTSQEEVKSAENVTKRYQEE
jgi:hypothetical protein